MVKEIIAYYGIFEFGHEWILGQIEAVSGSNAFCSCMYLLYKDKNRSSMSPMQKEKLEKWCRAQLNADKFSLSGSWYHSENVKIVKKVATEILTGPNGEWLVAKDKELLEKKVKTLEIHLSAGASSPNNP